MTKTSTAHAVLTLRELNRAMLARQLLLERSDIGIVPAIERLAALQAQWSPSPYIALWSRLADFRREKLWSAIERHDVVRARLMRGTLHLVSARPVQRRMCSNTSGSGSEERLAVPSAGSSGAS